MPDKAAVDTLVIPLVRMLELAYISSPREDRPLKISAVKNYINRSYSQRLSLELVSREFSCSRSYISHMFKKAPAKAFANILL